jgi:hypothetical protein
VCTVLGAPYRLSPVSEAYPQIIWDVECITQMHSSVLTVLSYLGLASKCYWLECRAAVGGPGVQGKDECLDVKICFFDHFVVANFTQQCHSSVVYSVPATVQCARAGLCPVSGRGRGAWHTNYSCIAKMIAIPIYGYFYYNICPSRLKNRFQRHFSKVCMRVSLASFSGS